MSPPRRALAPADLARAYGQLRWAFVPGDGRAYAVITDAEAPRQLEALSGRLRFGSREDRERLARASEEFPTPASFTAAYERTFRGARLASPFETDYTTVSPFEQANSLADISGFYRAFELAHQSADIDRADHVAAELEFLCVAAWLEARALDEGRGQDAAVVAAAHAAFLGEHAGRWLYALAARLDARGAPAYFASAARLAASLVDADMASREVPPAPPRSAGLPMA